MWLIMLREKIVWKQNAEENMWMKERRIWRKEHEVIHNLYFLLNIIRVIKSDGWDKQYMELHTKF
jgi:hypothetical protein